MWQGFLPLKLTFCINCAAATACRLVPHALQFICHFTFIPVLKSFVRNCGCYVDLSCIFQINTELRIFQLELVLQCWLQRAGIRGKLPLTQESSCGPRKDKASGWFTWWGWVSFSALIPVIWWHEWHLACKDLCINYPEGTLLEQVENESQWDWLLTQVWCTL